MKIQVRKCGFTGKLFVDDQTYLQHLKYLRNKQRRNREHKRVTASWNAAIDQIRHECIQFEELQEWLNQHCPTLLAMHDHRRGRSPKQHKGVKLQFKFIRMNFSKKVRNTHSAPRSGVTNWYRASSAPTGYPGWCGRILIHGLDLFDGFVSDLFTDTCIHVGAGGLGSYEVKLWADDWPNLLIYQQLTGDSP